mgnify:CR=1 FL=1
MKGDETMNITLYSTNCPRCRVLEEKMKEKNLKFETVTDVNEMITKKIEMVPMLVVVGKMMDIPTALKWVREI